MTTLDLFKGFLGSDSRLRLFTWDNRALIPKESGCYAWYFPLWILSEDFELFVQTTSKLLFFEPKAKQHKSIRFLKDTIELDISKKIFTDVIEDYEDQWDEVVKDEESKESLQKMLLEMSFFMPPLYIGKTKDLQRRYNEHTKGGQNTNNFYSRFSSYMRDEWAKTEIPRLEVADLLFLCIQTSGEQNSTTKNLEKITGLLEHILIRLCRPSFSIRG